MNEKPVVMYCSILIGLPSVSAQFRTMDIGFAARIWDSFFDVCRGKGEIVRVRRAAARD